MKNFLLGILVTLILFGIAGGAFYLGQKSKDVGLDSTPTSTPIPVVEQGINIEPINSPVPINNETDWVTNPEIKEKILIAVSTKNYSLLEEYMQAEVEVVKEATECCGMISKEEAIGEMAYLNNAQSPWLFEPENEKVKQLNQNYPDYYGENDIIGISTDEMVVSFRLDSDNMIKGVSMGASVMLLIP